MNLQARIRRNLNVFSSRLSRTILLLTLFSTTVYLYIYRYHYSTDQSPSLETDYADITPIPPPVTTNLSPTNITYLQPVDVRIEKPIDPLTGRANATLVMLARNSDLNGAMSAVRSLEEAFNSKLANPYPWVFLNEVPFDEDFIRELSSVTSGEAHFGLIKSEEWFMPDWIDGRMVEMGKNYLKSLPEPWPIPYADSTPYRNMCRYNSGFFYKHELLSPYKWYWRVEPDVEFLCPIEFDPFAFMIEHNKRYSFVIALQEIRATVRSLWSTVSKGFRVDHPELLAEDNALPFVSDDSGETYNYCHFWSNFEIADLDFFRSEPYETFFNYLDKTGNFYYERWGDAPVHSIAASLMLPRSQIHFFGDIGYYHAPFQHCPVWKDYPQLGGKCDCKNSLNFDKQKGSCLRKFADLFA